MEGARRNLAHAPAYGTAALMLAILIGAVALWVTGVRELTLGWIPTWGAEIALVLDGFGFMYTLLAGGIGLAVALYSLPYIPRHLAETSAPRSREPRFYAFLSLFAVSMVGLATADDLLLLFVFWDLTAIASYYLIAIDREKQAARSGALAAMVITGATAVLLLIALVVLWSHYGTLSIASIVADVREDTLTTVAGGLIIAAALAKSAQVPFHLWLPRAMVAPTPISAYLHSAAMVAAGVLLVGRTYPLLEGSSLLLDLLLVAGLASIATGAALALREDELKPILAYSTISQYGYVVAIYGIGGALAATAAALYVVGHAIAKSALFLTVGAIGRATGTERLDELGGVGRRMPALAAASAVAAAAVAGLPLTVGFFGDEYFFESLLERGWPLGVAAGAAAALSLAYIARFWGGIFLGPPRAGVERVPALLVAPILGLAALVIVGGTWGVPFTSLAEEAGAASLAEHHLSSAYHLDLRTTNVVALAAYGAGTLLIAGMPFVHRGALAVGRAGDAFGPARLYDGTVSWSNRVSDWMHGIEARELRTRVAAVLLPAGVLTALGLSLPLAAGEFVVGGLPAADGPLVAALAVAVLAAGVLVMMRSYLHFALVYASLGFALALVYALFGAPDVALIAVLVETALALFFFGLLAALPGGLLRRESRLGRGHRRIRDPAIGLVAGLFAFTVVWTGLSGAQSTQPDGSRYIALSSEIGADDAVTAILADFRALDTLGEVTVIVVAVLGVVGFLRSGAPR